jgi:tetratricopeptide (TPR) repeat protein
MPPEENTTPSEDIQNRGLRTSLPISYATYVDRWAIVVGISKYKSKSLNLKYADRDAEALYELLLTPSGGGFEKEHVIKLVNEEATTAKITRALRSFLKKPAKEDIVLIYFACHGAPDIDRPGIVYLLTHDVDPKDISGTALPMREIDLSLKENLLAERVIILADTCHSAAIGGGIGRRDAGDNSAVVNSYLREVGKSRGGVALLTSAEANEVSFEDEKWGDGHGVFTHYLLEGMKGAADRSPKNGVVTVGELFEYVRENVQKDTDNKQHPCVGTNSYDRNLPVAITAGISAQEHYELGCHLYQIGLKLDDKYCFESASRHLQEAIRQAAVVGSKLPEAHLRLGLALTASGNLPNAAVTAFEKAIKADLPDADYYLGIAYLNQGKTEEAKQHLEAFLSKQRDSDKAGAVQELISWFDASNSSHSEAANRHALLIGINYTDNPEIASLKGPVNDIEILNEVLSKKYNFKIKMLSDMEATHENIINAFHELQELTSPKDVVVIYYSGHGSGDFWIPADMKSIDSNELYSLIDAIPALHKYLIIDTQYGEAIMGFIGRVKRTKLCNLFLGASIGHFVPEVNIEDTQKTHGYFTYTLVQELQRASQKISIRDLFERVKESVQSKFPDQTPFFLGDIDKPLFFADLEHCPELFTFSQRRCYSAFNDSSLQSLNNKISKQFTTGFPDFYYSLGLAYLEKGNNPEAIASLKTAVGQAKQEREEKLFSLGVAQFNSRNYQNASQTLKKYIGLTIRDSQKPLINNLISEIDRLDQSEPFALLIGIENYAGINVIESLGNIADDVLNLQKVLIEKLGFRAENIKVLLNQDATYQNLLAAFETLVKISQTDPAIFYFAGLGSVNAKDDLTILASDSRQQGISDISLTELAQYANQSSTNLVSILDSSWCIGENRFIEYEEANIPSSRGLSIIIERENYSKISSIGHISIYSKSVKYLENRPLTEGKKFNSSFTTNLANFLSSTQIVGTPNSYQILKNFCDENGIYFTSSADSLEETILSNAVLLSNIQNFFFEIENESIRYAVFTLKRLIEQHNGMAPEELFNLGIAHYILKNYGRSITALQTAIDQVVTNTRSEASTMPPAPYPEAHYWLGRVLYESKKDPARAVSELRLATQESPDNIAAHYYLGKALRALVEQEILKEAERAYRTYLNAGSPLGQQEEVQEFLRSRQQVST